MTRWRRPERQTAQKHPTSRKLTRAVKAEKLRRSLVRGIRAQENRDRPAGLVLLPPRLVQQQIALDALRQCARIVISTINERVKAWRFLLNGPALIEEAYKKVPFPLFKRENHTY